MGVGIAMTTSLLQKMTVGWQGQRQEVLRTLLLMLVLVVGLVLGASSTVQGWMTTQGGTWFPVSLHTLMEFGAVLFAFLVFSVAWHTSVIGQPGYVLLIGCGLLAVGMIDLGHTLSYQGMPMFFTPADTEKAIRFWLAARYTAALVLLMAALPLRRHTWGGGRYVVLGGTLVYVAGVYTVCIFYPEVWPRTFIAGEGLTPFKIWAERGVMVLSGFAAFALIRWAQSGRTYNTQDLCLAALITVLSEVCFTLYENVHGLYMLLGHLYKIIAYYFIYRAVFVTSMRDPYTRLRAEVQERREAEQRVEFLAYHDVLTKLPNRELAKDRFQQALVECQRRGTLVAMIFIDLDDFKTINDTLGHAVGDRLLQWVAQCLREHVRQSDTVCRLGGDEFLLILKDLPDVEAVAPVVTKLLAELSKPMVLDGHELATAASIGIAMAPNDGQDFETLSQHADIAMYRAKEEGRQTYRFFDDRMNRELMERMTLQQDLRKALDQKQFELFYQPQMDLSTRQLVGVEALIRWRHPERGLLSPAVFIPAAEESGLIVAMGDWVIQEAARQNLAWQAQGLPPMTVAVNLSAVQFRRGHLEAVVRDTLATTGLAPELLELELTESVLISDSDAVESRLKALKALGVILSIDDFGTGYSSLSYLRKFSVDKLKIDQSFVRDLIKAPEDVGIVRAIIQMAHSLGLKTIAEGVETMSVADTLAGLGCDEVQGYAFARPMPANELVAWIQAQA